jgi:hypothetical protein
MILILYIFTPVCFVIHSYSILSIVLFYADMDGGIFSIVSKLYFGVPAVGDVWAVPYRFMVPPKYG